MQANDSLYSGFENIVRLLIVSHAEIDVKDNFGKISLFLAAQNGNKKIFNLTPDTQNFFTTSFVLQIRAFRSLQVIDSGVRE